MFSKTRLPKLIWLHLRSVRGEWVAQKICPSRIFAFADLSGPMLSGKSHQARGGPCGELTSATGRLGGRCREAVSASDMRFASEQHDGLVVILAVERERT